MDYSSRPLTVQREASFARDVILITILAAFVFAIYRGSVLLTAPSYKGNKRSCTVYFLDSTPKRVLVRVV